jgi:hypothetical protein
MKKFKKKFSKCSVKPMIHRVFGWNFSEKLVGCFCCFHESRDRLVDDTWIDLFELYNSTFGDLSIGVVAGPQFDENWRRLATRWVNFNRSKVDQFFNDLQWNLYQSIALNELYHLSFGSESIDQIVCPWIHDKVGESRARFDRFVQFPAT